MISNKATYVLYVHLLTHERKGSIRVRHLGRFLNSAGIFWGRGDFGGKPPEFSLQKGCWRNTILLRPLLLQNGEVLLLRSLNSSYSIFHFGFELLCLSRSFSI